MQAARSVSSVRRRGDGKAVVRLVNKMAVIVWIHWRIDSLTSGLRRVHKG